MAELVQYILDMAGDAVEHFGDRTDHRLDFSEESLAMVEELLAEASDFVSEMSEERVDSIVELLGCYVLEVGHRHFGGKFYWHEGRNQPVLVAGEPAYRVAIMTFDKVRGRLGGDRADNIPFFYEGFSSAARKAEPGSDVLYV